MLQKFSSPYYSFNLQKKSSNAALALLHPEHRLLATPLSIYELVVDCAHWQEAEAFVLALRTEQMPPDAGIVESTVIAQPSPPTR